ncbi:hypothetical protein J7E83_17575 [Arthrobacter sp. ISL-48]|uniref:hypothetical protein n=1 Tax=Arthrobacter sp. ISL-48 TaxID=2819110 RepID=UPI001BE81D85|nr:hypothetical protein [Arthrobacter sp. ISL-48]MBT2533901.1 hypothetical protein [Arthrobacter sp. ISL-48]
MTPSPVASTATAAPSTAQPSRSQTQTQTPPAVSGPITVTVDQVSAQPGGTFTGSVMGLDPLFPAQATLTRTYPSRPAVTSTCVLTPQPANQDLSCALPGDQAQGAYDVVVAQADAGGKTRTGTSTTVYVVQTPVYDPHVTGPNLPIAPGTSASIKGTAFVPGGTVTLTTSSLLLPGGTATVDAGGNFDFVLTPSPFTPEAQYVVNVVDDTTGVNAQLSVYVLRANASLASTVNTGVVGGYNTTISGTGFAAGSYALDLTLYNSDGTTIVTQLAKNVAVKDGALASTSVTIPANTPAGLYQVAATSGQARLAATWIAVFPEPTVVTPDKPGLPVVTPVVPIVPVAPLPSDPTVQAPAPAPVPLIHQIIAAPTTDPFTRLLTDKVPDLNSSTPNAANSGLLSQDPTPEVFGQTPGSQTTPTTPEGPTAAATTQVSATSDFPWWVLILVGVLAAGLGLGGGYGIAATGRKRR